MRDRLTENEVLNRPDPFDDAGGIYHGTVGWDDGQGKHFDMKPGEITLVKVTLFVGRDPRAEVPDDGLAHGRQILASVAAPLFKIPAPGTVVHVSIPAGCWSVPGAGVIFAEVLKAPPNQFSESTSKLDFGPDANLVIKAGQVAITDYENRYISVSPKGGIKMADADGTMVSILNKAIQVVVGNGAGEEATAIFELGAGKLRVALKDGSKQAAMVLNPDQFAVTCKSFVAECSSGKLGAGPILPAQGIACTVAGPANVISTSWVVAP